MRIAYFSPLPPQKSGIAAYSANLLPHLGQTVDLVLFADEAAGVEPGLRESFSIRHIESFTGPLPEGFDLCLYQMGNHIRYHEQIYTMLRRHPGIVVLHDLNLHAFHGELFLRRGQTVAYTREMAYAYGAKGAQVARLAHEGQYAYQTDDYLLSERIVETSLSVIVHSRYAQRVVQGLTPTTPVVHINQPVPMPAHLPSLTAAKASLHLSPDTLLLASFGYVAPSKRIEAVLQALARLRPDFPQLKYVLVGELIEGYELSPLLAELALDDVVELAGYADEATFQTYLAATDIGINLRYPTLGETSATLLALMAAAKPVLVSNVDAFAEMPDGACVKVAVGQAERDQIETGLRALITNDELRQQIGRQAAAYVRQSCHPPTIAQQYVDFIRQIIEVC